MSSQSASRLRVSPREVFVGDLVQIEYVFISDNPTLSSAGVKLSSEQMQSYSTAASTVTDAQLSVSGNECTVLITFIPWKTGSLSLPRIDFGTESLPFYVDIPPVHINSLIETTGIRELRPPAAPFVIPGTTHILYSILVGLIILAALACVLFVKFRSIKKWLAANARRRKYRRNYSLLLKTLRTLEKKGLALSGGEFTTRIVQSARQYLDGRYEPVFSVSTTAELLARAREADLPQTAVSLLHDVCTRCDAVRFTAESANSAVPDADERKNLLVLLRDAARECEHAGL